MDYAEVRERLRAILAERLSMASIASSADRADVADVASACSQQATDLVVLKGRELRFVRAAVAIRRLDDGSYGICLQCGEEIAEKRLKAVPEALHCCNCQEMLDGGKK